jgi:hypothetical protein
LRAVTAFAVSHRNGIARVLHPNASEFDRPMGKKKQDDIAPNSMMMSPDSNSFNTRPRIPYFIVFSDPLTKVKAR